MTDAEFEKLKEAIIKGLNESHSLSPEEYEQRDWDRTRPSPDKIKPINTPVFKKHVFNDDGTVDYELADDVERPTPTPVARNWVRFWNRMLPALALAWFGFLFLTDGAGFNLRTLSDAVLLTGILSLLVWILGHLILWATRGLRE